jgi:hypothetical protein
VFFSDAVGHACEDVAQAELAAQLFVQKGQWSQRSIVLKSAAGSSRFPEDVEWGLLNLCD